MSNVDEQTDEQLVELTRSKNQELYAVLVKRYETKLLRYAMTFVKDEDEAADVVQEAFIKAFRNLNGFDTAKKWSSWIYRIVHNEAMNHISKQKQHVLMGDGSWIDLVFHHHDNTDERIDKEQLLNLLNKRMDEMPVAYSEPLILFYREEKSYEEISEIMHLPIATVGTRVHRGRKMLQELTKKQGPK